MGYVPYTKTYWQLGDTITAEKLNNIEDGVYNNNTVCNDALTLSSLLNTTSLQFAVVPVSGNTYAVVDGSTQTPVSFATALNTYTSVMGAFFAMVLNQAGTAFRVMTVVAASIPDQTVNLMCIDSGVLYELALQDSGNGLVGTLTTKTL